MDPNDGFNINGRHYDSIDDVPDDNVRRSLHERFGNEVHPHVINGVRYDRAEDIDDPETRRALEVEEMYPGNDWWSRTRKYALSPGAGGDYYRPNMKITAWIAGPAVLFLLLMALTDVRRGQSPGFALILVAVFVIAFVIVGIQAKTFRYPTRRSRK